MARINLSQKIHDEVVEVSGPAAMTIAPANSKKAVNDGDFTHQNIHEVNTIDNYFEKSYGNVYPNYLNEKSLIVIFYVLE